MSGAHAYSPRRAVREARIAVRGLNVRVSEWGPVPAANAPARVFLHGFLDTGSTFQFLVDAFQADWAIAAPDWRGFGESEWTPGGYWFPDYLADLDALLERLSPARPAHLVGHSMGGNVAALYAGVRPHRVESLVSIEGFGLPGVPSSEAPARVARWLSAIASPPQWRSYASLEELARVIRSRNPHLALDRASFIASQWARQTDEGRVVLRADPAHRRVNPALYRRDEAQSVWQKIEAPMLLLLGTRSPIRRNLGPEGDHKVLQKSFPTARLVDVEGATHMLHWEHSETLASLIEDFWRGLPS